MKIKKLLPLAMVLACIAHNTLAMKREYPELSYTISNIVELDEFWQKVKCGDIPHDKAAYKLRKKISEFYRKKDISKEDLDKEIDTILQQAVYAGISPSTSIKFNSQYDIMTHALKTDNAPLVELCFEEGYSPDNAVVYLGTKVLALAITPFSMWPLFKQYGANFNIIIKDEFYGTLLHKSTSHQNAKEVQWLLQETAIDINQPDGHGNTVGHTLADMFYLGNKKNGKETFKILIQNGIDRFQKNNINETPKDIAEQKKNWYIKKLSTDPYNVTLKNFQSKAHKMASLWKKYEKKYATNNCYKNIVKHCYCGDFTYSNKNDLIVQSQNLTTEQIHNAFNFFPYNSMIGYFCKNSPDNNDGIAIAKLYTSFNNIHHLSKKRSSISMQLSQLRQERVAIIEKLEDVGNQRQQLSHEEMLELVDPTLQAQFKIKDQLPRKEQRALNMAVSNALDEKFGMTYLWTQRDSIDQQSEQLNVEYNTVSREEKKKCKIIYGYHSALDFNICSRKTAYHQAVKNLLEIVPSHDLKMIEAEKINQGLHNAYHNKKQS